MTLRAWTIGSVLTASILSGFGMLGCSTTAAGPEDSEASVADLTERAADATGKGPLAVTSSEYRLPASVDQDILGDRMTEVWAHVYRPKTVTAGEKHPLLVFLHGNHGTCGKGSNPRIDNNTQYTTQGTCPAGYVVTPNHLGYAYIAERLASWGYIVVSINANRGITAGGGAPADGGLNLARGRLVLKHLELLSGWNKTAGTTPASLGVDLKGLIDFEQVGMMGHSRGGEGVRAAYVQYNDPNSPWPAKIKSPLGVKGIFEIGPVDGQTSRVLDAKGTAWNVVLPMCDGDVSNLQGMKPFDRMLAANDETTPAPKGMFAVWGANHNFYNTEWQTSDARGCRGAGNPPLFETSGVVGSASQQATGLHALMGFFRANVGANRQAAFNRAYDPQYGLPESLETVAHIGRAYADSSSTTNTRVLEDFSKPAGTSLGGQPIVAENVTVTHGAVPEHDAALKAASVTWTTAGAGTSLEIPFAASGSGVSAVGMQTLDVRVSLKNVAATVATPTSFSIQLVNADGSTSKAVSLKSYVELATGGHVVLDTARIPLKDFKDANLAAVRGIRFVFDETASGSVYLASLRLSKPLASSVSNVSPGQPESLAQPGIGNETVKVETGNQVADVRLSPSDEVEVELASAVNFPVTDELPRLRIGKSDVVISRFNDDGDTHRIVFKMTPKQFAETPNGAPIQVRYGDETAAYEFDFGTFDKNAAHR